MRKLTATLCLTIALLLGGMGMSWSNYVVQLKPLSEILRQESSEVTKVYALERCYVLLFASSRKLRQRGAKHRIVADQILQKALLFGSIALKVKSPEAVKRRVAGILKLYETRWEINQNATGNQFGTLTMSDMRTCNSIHKTLTGKK